MGGLPDLFASIPLVAWGMFALGAAITAAAGVLPHLRRAYPAIEIELPAGILVRVLPGASSEQLREVLAALETSRC